MAEQTKSTLVCDYCQNPVKASDEFCPNCGSLFEENFFCANHSERSAKGVCIICGAAYCSACGGRMNDRFLCERHWAYEIYEGMARVFGVSDFAMAQYASNCLSQAGLHPFVYSRRVVTIGGGASEWTLFVATGDYDGHIINEFKVMVPCHEVMKAESVLAELEITKRVGV
jgi:hypothetical protein